jgi:hypothetical protein
VVIETDHGQVQDVQDVFQLHRGELKAEHLGLRWRRPKELWKECSGFCCENHSPNNQHVLWFSRKALFMGVWRHRAVPKRAQK